MQEFGQEGAKAEEFEQKADLEQKLNDFERKGIIGSNSCETGLLKPTKPKISLNKKIPHG